MPAAALALPSSMAAGACASNGTGCAGGGGILFSMLKPLRRG